MVSVNWDRQNLDRKKKKKPKQHKSNNDKPPHFDCLEY